uniref:Uncharacterized protein n=1 Tax=Steinernema glaseri TaxID=37863 RepID=A0A1I8AKX0_9BILA
MIRLIILLLSFRFYSLSSPDMDGVPLAFYDDLCDILSTDALRGANELSGYLGTLSRLARKNRAQYTCFVRKGKEEQKRISYKYNGSEVPREVEKDFPKKYVRDVTIHLEDAENEDLCRRLVRSFPYAKYHFVHKTSSVSKDWVDLVYSLKRLGQIVFEKMLNDDALYVLKKLIKGRKLSGLMMYQEACQGSTIAVAKALLLQRQFKKLEVRQELDYLSTPINELLEFWVEHSDKLRGKSLIVKGTHREGAQLEEFLRQRSLLAKMSSSLLSESNSSARRLASGTQQVFQLCSKEERDLIKKEYLLNHYIFKKSSCVYKFQEGRKRRFYLLFECAHKGTTFEEGRPPSHSGEDGLKLLRRARRYRILFA